MQAGACTEKKGDSYLCKASYLEEGRVKTYSFLCTWMLPYSDRQI